MRKGRICGMQDRTLVAMWHHNIHNTELYHFLVTKEPCVFTPTATYFGSSDAQSDHTLYGEGVTGLLASGKPLLAQKS
jgi:hypothetical protein